MIENGIDEEILERLERYGKTVISSARLKAHGGTKAVERYLRERGFENCRCWISSTMVPSVTERKKFTKSIIIEGRKRK